MSALPHITICICTYQRGEMIRALLTALPRQRTEGMFTFSIVVADNDAAESGRASVERVASTSPVPIEYRVEPDQNIALARNRSVAGVTGDFVAFIDDDEIPDDGWLLAMYRAVVAHGADGAFGPVFAEFEEPPPAWMVQAGLFDRPSYGATGAVIDWRQTGMGNVLVRRGVLDLLDGPFDPAFGGGGEDIDFFRRAMALGKVFIWCLEATVSERVPAVRTRMGFQLRRALLRGKATLANPEGRGLGIAKSVVAVAVYTPLLPVFLLAGRHVAARYLVKDFDHLGKLLALAGVDVVKVRYVTK